MQHEPSTKTFESQTGESIPSPPPALFETSKLTLSWKVIAVGATFLVSAGGIYAVFKSHIEDKNLHLHEGERLQSAVVATEMKTVLQQLQAGQMRVEEKLEAQGRDLEQIKRDLAVEIDRSKRSSK